MKKKFISIIILILLLNCKSHERFETEKDEFAIVTASILNSRKKPDVKSDLVGKFHFGSPILINTKDSFEDTVDGEKGKWIKEKVTNGYIFSKYYIITSGNIYKLKGVVDICNFPCGGSCFIPPGDLYLVGNFYIEIDDHMDYLPEDRTPCSTIRIGTFKKDNEEYIFSSPIKYAGYNGKNNHCRITFLSNLDKIGDKIILDHLKKPFNLKRMSDSKGPFYIINNKMIYDRSRYHEYCSEQSLHDKVIEVFDSYYIDEKIDTNNLFSNYSHKFNEIISE
ncbi:hypothetical protein ND816_18025 [Leptospira levettii]|uniref:hypothetical protein n=1 Tax=Leptospira levettii TaxID=2023178 RepID=UPI00223DBED6|nr:hypothetical protein [Leptospira levettii]MCW7509752.1 hypothetical protein [Leptospira levettii]MCW7520836.1 hypothetical protein [Leptospira levettii]